jgi:hypothetical protein
LEEVEEFTEIYNFEGLLLQEVVGLFMLVWIFLIVFERSSDDWGLVFMAAPDILY